jgi:pimeloyl-ACP methyl ester carboxylesterase
MTGLSTAGRHGHVTVQRRRPATGPGRPVRVLLVPGLAGSAGVWDALADRCPESLDIWIAQPPWASTGDGRWSHETDASSWITEAVLALDEPVDAVVAHSFAAAMLLEQLVRQDCPIRPRAVVLVSPFYRARPQDFDWSTLSKYLNGFHAILEEGLRLDLGGQLPDDVRSLMALRLRDCVGPYGWLRFFDAYLRTPFLDAVAVRPAVLVVSGDRDLAAPPSDARALAQALPGAQLELITDCGHFPMAEYPDRMAALLATFLDPWS